MIDFGALDRWPAKYCEKKWRELHPETSTSSNLPVPPTSQWLQDATSSVYGTPLPLSELPEQPYTPSLRTPGIHTPGIHTPKTRTP